MTAPPVDIVVVDDVAEAAQAVAEFLTFDGYRVLVASTGQEALRLVDEHQPLSVLIDIDMPGMNGLEVARRLRETHGSRLLLVAFSGLGDSSSLVLRTLELVDDYIGKPVDAAKLRRLYPPLEL